MTPSDVLGMGDGFEVRRVHARRGTTQMIQFESVRDRADESLIGDPMPIATVAIN